MFEDNYKHKGLRNKLVELLKTKGITNLKVLEAMRKVPRHFFLDNAFVIHAYQDKAFQIGEGQTISQPYTVAYQTSLLELRQGEKVLEIGTGSGYQTCILLEQKVKVYTIETVKKLYERTSVFLPKLGYNPHFFLGDGTKGLPSFGPFDKILVTAGSPSIPKSLLEQLKPTGILVIPVGDNENQKMVRVTKTEMGTFEMNEYDNFSFVPLVGEEGWK